MKTNESSIKKSKYKYGRRRTRSLGGFISSEICKTIDMTLPPAERLRLLIEYSLSNALSIAEKKVGTNIDSDTFNNEISERLDIIDKSLKENDLYNSAASGTKSSLNESLVDYYNQYEDAKSKLEQECKEWENLISNERIANENVNSKTMSPIKYDGSLDVCKYDKLDYSEILEDISYIAGSYSYKVDRLECFKKKVDTCANLAEEYKKYLSKEAEKYFSCVPGTPRTLIKKFNSA